MLRVPALRRWQKEALAGFEASKAPSYLAVATPGAGKTTFALMAARRALLARRAARIVVVVPTSDDPLASRRIAGFRDSQEPWLVAVRMVSQGVDLPRLRVGVYATTTTTDLFFRQAVGRLVRFVRGKGRQSAYMFVPEDARICSFALEIKRPRRHSLRPPDEAGEAIDREETADEEHEQLDLFAAIASRALGSDGQDLRPEDVWDAEEDIEAEQAWLPEPDEPPDLAAPVPLPASSAPDPPNPQKASARERRRELRELNQARVETLVRLTRLSHAQINERLNARVGLKRISEATEKHLQARADAARRWIQGDGPSARA